MLLNGDNGHVKDESMDERRPSNRRQYCSNSSILCLSEQPANRALFAIFFLYAATVVVDKFGEIFRTISVEAQERDLTSRLDRLPSLFAGRNDVVTFTNTFEGVKYCISVCQEAISVKNTVLRQGKPDTYMAIGGGDIYLKWLSAKEESLQKACAWTEIVSAHIVQDDPQRIFMAKVKESKLYYDYFDVKDNAGELGYTMVQMTIFQFANGTKEIIFGWNFPRMLHGPCFLTRNSAIIEFFDNYFSIMAELSSTENNVSTLKQPSPPTSAKASS